MPSAASKSKLPRDISMWNCAIADNWALQVIAQMLSEGLETGDAPLLDVKSDRVIHKTTDVPAGAIAIEAVFDLIADIVLRQQIWVDQNFQDTWQGKSKSIDKLVEAGVIVPFNFSSQSQELEQPRKFFVSKLCVTESLKIAQAENEKGWSEAGVSPHRYLSQVVWGGAGMLARAAVYRQAYTPHPVRRRLLMDAKVAWAPDAVQDVRDVIAQKRASVSTSSGNNRRITSLNINGAEIAAIAIRESKDLEGLFANALQLRAEYAELRAWLTEFQTVIHTGNAQELNSFEKILHSSSAFIDRRLGKAKPGGPSFRLSLGLMQVTFQGDPVDHLKNRFGVQAQINRLAFDRPRTSDLEKLLDLFGERTSTVGLRIADHFAVASN